MQISSSQEMQIKIIVYIIFEGSLSKFPVSGSSMTITGAVGFASKTVLVLTTVASTDLSVVVTTLTGTGIDNAYISITQLTP